MGSRKRRGRKEYLLRWQGYTEEWDSWAGEEDFDEMNELLAEWELRNRRPQGMSTKTRRDRTARHVRSISARRLREMHMEVNKDKQKVFRPVLGTERTASKTSTTTRHAADEQALRATDGDEQPIRRTQSPAPQPAPTPPHPNPTHPGPTA